MRNVLTNRPRIRRNRIAKLTYSLPLFLFLILIILIWSQFQPHSHESSSFSSSSRHLLESNGDFPDDPFTSQEKKNGYIVFHCLLMVYMFMGLAKICDDYFEPTLEVLCERLEIKDDVAGATWMAAGGSAPELFTSIIGVFIAKSDIGFGTIVGSAVFNVLAVISACAFFVPDLPVTGWPLARDSIYYCFGILIIISCVEDQRIYWYEALILLIFYVVYVYIMKHNEKLEGLISDSLNKTNNTKFQRKLQSFFQHSVTQVTIYCAIIINVTFVVFLLFADSSFAEQINVYISLLFVIEMLLKLYAYGAISYWVDVWNALDGVLVVLIVVEYILAQSAGSGAARALRVLRLGRTFRSFRIFKLLKQLNTIHIATGTQTHNMSMVADAENIPQSEENLELDTEIRKIEILSSHLSPSHQRPSLHSINERESSNHSIVHQNEEYESTTNQILSPLEKAQSEFKYDKTICVRHVARDNKKIVFFEQDRSKKSKAAADNNLKPRCIRLITNASGAKSFEEYYSVRGSRVSRSYKGSFNLAIMPVDKGANAANICDVSFNSDWKANVSADFSMRKEETGDDDEPLKLWEFPSDESIYDQITYLLMFPLSAMMFYTIADVRKEGNERYWMVSFALCILWIALLSYVMVWMASEIGITANIPEPIMGITILAAGTSIPDMLSSLAVAKKGRGDMAVSSSIGSNIFDILFGLPFPWLIKTAIVSPGSYVFIESDGMTIMVLSLFLMVAFVILSIQQFQWKLSKKLAYVFAVLYLLFVLESILIEKGVIFN